METHEGVTVEYPEDQAAPGYPDGLYQGVLGFIEELQGVDHYGEVEFIVRKGQVLGPAVGQLHARMESPARLLQHGGTGVKAGEKKADALKRGEVKTGAAADIEEPLPGTRLEEAVDERAL